MMATFQVTDQPGKEHIQVGIILEHLFWWLTFNGCYSYLDVVLPSWQVVASLTDSVLGKTDVSHVENRSPCSDWTFRSDTGLPLQIFFFGF